MPRTVQKTAAVGHEERAFGFQTERCYAHRSARCAQVFSPSTILVLLAIAAGWAVPAPGTDAADRPPLRIVLLKQPGMPAQGLDVDLEAALRRRPDVHLSVVDSDEIVRNGVRGDGLQRPRRGVSGGHRGPPFRVSAARRRPAAPGRPFETAVKRRDGKWSEVVATFDERLMPHRIASPDPAKERIDLFGRGSE